MNGLSLGLGIVLALVAIAGGGLALSGGGDTADEQPATRDAAVAFWEERVDADTSDYVALSRLGRAYAAYARVSGDVRSLFRAQDAFERALALQPGDVESKAGLANVYVATHQFAKAVELAQAIYDNDPRATSALATIGDAQMALGNYEAGAETYRELAALESGPAVLSRQAHLAELYGDPEEAIRLLSRADGVLTKRGNAGERLAWFRAQIGDRLFAIGRYEEARTAYERSLQALPGYRFALGGLAAVAAAEGEVEEAIGLYELGLTQAVEPPFLAALGDLYSLTGDEEASRRSYEAAREASSYEVENGIPHIHEFVMLHAGYGVETQRSVELALEQLETRRDIYAYDAAAWALYVDGRVDEAMPLIESALQLGTKDPRLIYHAGMIALETGDDDRARKYLTEALELSPHFSPLGAEVARMALAEVAG